MEDKDHDILVKCKKILSERIEVRDLLEKAIILGEDDEHEKHQNEANRNTSQKQNDQSKSSEVEDSDESSTKEPSKDKQEKTNADLPKNTSQIRGTLYSFFTPQPQKQPQVVKQKDVDIIFTDSDDSDYSEDQEEPQDLTDNEDSDYEPIDFSALDQALIENCDENSTNETNPNQNEKSDEESEDEIHTSSLFIPEENKEATSTQTSVNENDVSDSPYLSTDSPLDEAWESLKTILINYGWEKEKIDQTYEAYFFWLTQSCEKLKIPKNSDDDSAWTYNKTKSYMKNLAELRDMLIVIPASEAACERALSKLKKVVSPTANNTGEKVEMAKLIYMTST